MSSWFELKVIVSIGFAIVLMAEILTIGGYRFGRGTSSENGRGGEGKALKQAVYQQAQATHSGDGSNMRQLSGSRGKIAYGWNGDIRMPRVQGRMEPVLCSLIDLPAGKFGTQTPVDPKWLQSVCAGLA